MTVDASWLLEMIWFVPWTLSVARVVFWGGADWLEDTVSRLRLSSIREH